MIQLGTIRSQSLYERYMADMRAEDAAREEAMAVLRLLRQFSRVSFDVKLSTHLSDFRPL